ncbi:MAG: hypothetical protein U0L26_02410 [Cellulosilyticum sp.]|nr:hypothetical protein [Cellulosilyticum sp.]
MKDIHGNEFKTTNKDFYLLICPKECIECTYELNQVAELKKDYKEYKAKGYEVHVVRCTPNE